MTTTASVPRVLVVTSTFPRWRDDTEPAFVMDLCSYLCDRGFEVDVLAPHTAGALRREVLDGVNVYRYRYCFDRLEKLAYAGGILSNLRNNPLKYMLVPLLLTAQACAVYMRLKAASYQAIHAHWLIPQGLICALARIAASRGKVALICTSHGGDLYALDGPLLSRLKRWTIARCEHFCVVSRAMARRAVRLGASADRTSVMPMGVDLEAAFRPVENVYRNPRGLIFVGRLVEKKGVDVLLDAMAILVKTEPEAGLVIVGDGPLREDLERKAVNLAITANVRFFGAVPHHRLPEMYSAASIAVTPSVIAGSGDQEGLGLVIIEAMGCGCAVATSSLEAIRDVVDEETGILVTPGDAAELAIGIALLLRDESLRRTMAGLGREKARRLFDRRVTGERYFQLLSGIASTRGMQPC